MQFLSDGSSFLYILIKYYVDFLKNELRFMPLALQLLFESCATAEDENDTKQFLFLLCCKIRAEDQCTLSLLK